MDQYPETQNNIQQINIPGEGDVLAQPQETINPIVFEQHTVALSGLPKAIDSIRQRLLPKSEEKIPDSAGPTKSEKIALWTELAMNSKGHQKDKLDLLPQDSRESRDALKAWRTQRKVEHSNLVMSGFTKGVYDIDPETGLSKWRDSDGRLSHVSSKTARRILADERNFAKAKVHKDHITHKQKAALNRESDFVRMDKVIRTVDDRKARLETRVNYSVSRLNDARTVAEARRRKVDLQDINVATIDDLELTDRLQELAKPVVRKYYQTRRKISNLRANASDKRVTKRQRIVNERSLSRDIAAEKARETRDFFGITRS